MCASSDVEIGHVRAVNPAKRELRIRPIPGREKLFAEMVWMRARVPGNSELRYKVAHTRLPESDGADVIVALAAGVPRDTVARMKGAAVVAPREEAIRCADDGYCLDDLVGLRVLADGGQCLGIVTDAYPTGANPVMEIEETDGGLLLVPIISQVVKKADITRGELIVHDIRPYVVRSPAPAKRGAGKRQGST